MGKAERTSLYGEVTAKIIAELEAGRLPWVQPWEALHCPCTMPHNAISQRNYGGINILILWAAGMAQGYGTQRWLTYKQAEKTGAHVRRGARGTVICYADRFTPKAEAERAGNEGCDARSVAFLKRFTVFNVEQCEGFTEAMTDLPKPIDPVLAVAQADAVISRSGADFRICGREAYYSPAHDFIAVPSQVRFAEPINWYRTALHELGHWTGHVSRLNRDQRGPFRSPAYAREELVAEMASAFTCASLGVEPTVRHADYVGAWLEILRADEKAIFRAASAASRAADYLLEFGEAEA